ncbi:helix-turn-helix domain-containing protein [Nocardia otitidiscaviarum]|uniref:Helix-turn-helix transcriptional regulator n=1 Tax=Nocardia otitidiscaviarum TaxID=1823 RepID=A0A516NNP4_9NOCA|nr:helix-turn-helix transcriptional regulator [Nocardia otitidiscaviarum]MBF6181343.1 helix-turn-helix transcriptional regulator [Nocardia otitidiscaviarum]MCP9624245.1 helix-turn-helix transcriptional regulator [Nocardia otitidiscaviarum]QDP80517.1 helix-turn-helix transcriptional regulator [Nocardia otitidiscaviarum]
MTNAVQQQREALGQRLREIRRSAGVTGRELARREGWHESKVSKIEYGKIAPSESDLRAYCAHTGNEGQLPDLVATLRNLDAAYIEWRRILAAGTRHRQHQSIRLESEAEQIRNWQPQVIPGLLQTADYAEAILRYGVELYRVPDDVDAGVSKRMERQRILYRRGRRFHFLIAEQALYTTVGDDHVMQGQLDRLFSIIGMHRITVGIVPAAAEAKAAVENFVMFDNRIVKVEGTTAELTITQPREIAIYGRAFDILAAQSVIGDHARRLIRRAVEARTA